MVSVQWPWFAAPATVLFLGLSFFILALIQNSRLIAWKSSIIPVLHALSPDLTHSTGGMCSPNHLHAQDGVMTAKLEQDDDGFRLKGTNYHRATSSNT